MKCEDEGWLRLGSSGLIIIDCPLVPRTRSAVSWGNVEQRAMIPSVNYGSGPAPLLYLNWREQWGHGNKTTASTAQAHCPPPSCHPACVSRPIVRHQVHGLKVLCGDERLGTLEVWVRMVGR